MSQYAGRQMTTRKFALQALGYFDGPVGVDVVLAKMVELGWDSRITEPKLAVHATLNRMARLDGTVQRPYRGQYLLSEELRRKRPIITPGAAIANLQQAIQNVLDMSLPRASHVRVTVDIESESRDA